MAADPKIRSALRRLVAGGAMSVLAAVTVHAQQVTGTRKQRADAIGRKREYLGESAR